MSERSVRLGWRRRVAAVATLVRVPNLFTAPPDVVLGAALAAGAGAAVDLGAVVGLSLASAFLYAGGTALNDAFDAPRDASERPERPIPSGSISRTGAFGLGAGCLVVGVAVAVLVAGLRGGVVAIAVAVGILLYDGVLKGGAFGFATMGAVRGVNVALGTTAGAAWLPARWYLPAAALAAYVAAVTFMADREAEGGNRPAVAVAGFGLVLAVLAWLAHVAITEPGIAPAIVGTALVVGFLAWAGSALRAAYRDPVPGRVGPAVGVCVLGIVVLDAAFAAATGVAWAVATVAFLAPAVGLARAFDVS